MVANDVIAATAQTIAPSAGALAAANNLRIASLSIAAYDYFITLPSEIRLYRTASRRSLGFILFVMIRYSSILVLLFSNTGFFYHGFSPNVCAHWCYLTPVFKVLQMMVSQAILGIRTYNIAQRNVWVGRTLVFAYFFAAVLQWVTDLFNRLPVQTNGNCMTGSARPKFVISAWTFYLTAMLYDCLTLSISTYFLLKLKASAVSTTTKLLRILLYDGLGYLVALTAVNLMNIILYRRAAKSIQSSGASLEYAVTWIMSQRILIHLRGAYMTTPQAVRAS
ncbi:hypothetical protein BC826DRAFT_134641 [Russula brevipes]|nr:hypothetical protein BC826DRAFT_134641 [Russula brevipes]